MILFFSTLSFLCSISVLSSEVIAIKDWVDQNNTKETDKNNTKGIDPSPLDGMTTTPTDPSMEEDGGDEEALQNHPTSQPLRSSEIGIPVGMALDPPLCPPPPVTRSLGICYLQKCTTHKDCSRNGACCFNGCIHTCTKPMDRPAAFDWVEDTSKVLPILEVDSEDTPNLFLPILMENETSKYAAAEGGAELVHLPGGCYVTATRYLKLKEFMEAPSISQCRCSDGEVVCDVRMNRT